MLYKYHSLYLYAVILTQLNSSSTVTLTSLAIIHTMLHNYHSLYLQYAVVLTQLNSSSTVQILTKMGISDRSSCPQSGLGCTCHQAMLALQYMDMATMCPGPCSS